MNTQGETLEEARENLTDALEMVTNAYKELSENSQAGKKVIREKLLLVH